VFHMAACSSTTERDLGFLIRNNFELTKDLATWALEQGARFVYASSAATYGNQAVDIREEEAALQHLRPLNAYGFSKWLFDLHAARKGWFSHITGIKYFNIFGPNEDHKADMRSLVCKALGQVEQTGRLQLFKSHDPRYRDGEQQRDFLYVKDAVAMTVHLASNLQATGLFNVGSGMAHTWLALGRALFRALNREPQFEFIPMPPALHATYQYITLANIDKLRGAGYGFPITSLEDAVGDYVTRYLIPGQMLDPNDPDETGVMERLNHRRSLKAIETSSTT
jgi:ADP-L-glycero-D-manno-heptose 6-epimerase